MAHTIVFHTCELLRQVSPTPRDNNRIGTGRAKTTANVTNVIDHLGYSGEVPGSRPQAVYLRYTLRRPMTTETTNRTTYYSLHLLLNIPCAFIVG